MGVLACCTQDAHCEVTAVQETHFIYAADCRVLENDFNLFSAYDSRSSTGVSLLVGRRLDADVDGFFLQVMGTD